ncbi:TonB-dependent receptor [Martelella alba]|uniref:TonB-dependent receptor n=1 Tax=Martelella alba TaxID=2590451 RepID=A0A506UB82_9HYPH|nr:TonB-dependent receptor [Martelella alba]TPW29057.1 TonB-dependent receptor [Martelella alba]
MKTKFLLLGLYASTAMFSWIEGARADDEPVPFAITVDGQPLLSGNAPLVPSADGQTFAAPAVPSFDPLDNVDIQVKFDGLGAKPVLNVLTRDVEKPVGYGDTVDFVTSSNYPDFIQRAEIRVFKDDKTFSPDSVPMDVIPAKVNGDTQWVLPPIPDDEEKLVYVLRVYGQNGLYDETRARLIRLKPTTGYLNQPGSKLSRRAGASGPEDLQGTLDMSEDYAGIRNMVLNGGQVTVYGKNVPDGYRVEALNDNVPTEDGAFVIQRILPAGQRSVDVSVLRPDSPQGLEFSRDVEIPESEWFYVGLADLTVGQRSGSSHIEDVVPGEYDKIYTKGRVAFYLKGKIKGKYLMTASLDTGEGELKDLLPGLGDKKKRDQLRNLKEDDYYPVYGDDSVAYEDAPTRGKFFVRLQADSSQVMWGEYKVKIDGTELQKSNRALYGAQAIYQPNRATSFGAPRTKAQLYAAKPDELTATDQFKATDGSLYFLNHNDLVNSSETVTVEIRNRDTGEVLRRQTLSYGEDYTISYTDGRVQLMHPLPSQAGSTDTVRDGAIGGNDVYLVVQYNYEPTTTDVDGYVYGGRAEQWVGDHVRLGVTGSSDNSDGDRSKAYGGDVRLRYTDKTYLDAEVAKTEGSINNLSTSTDGGLSFVSPGSDGSGKQALGWRLAGQADLSDFSSSATGLIKGYFDSKEAGFSSITEDLSAPQESWGISARELQLTQDLSLDLSYDYFDRDSYYNEDSDSVVAGRTKQNGKASLSKEINDRLTMSFGLGYVVQRDPSEREAGRYGTDGRRLDTGVRASYLLNDEVSKIYGFGQVTANRQGNIMRNDRGGIGTNYQLTERLGANAEVSYGTTGLGGLVGLSYKTSDTDRYYMNYVLDPDRAYDWNRSYDLSGRDLGRLVVGAEKQLNDMWSAYAENSYDLYGERNDMSKTYGIKFAPDAVRTVEASYAGGQVIDNTINPSTGLKNADSNRDSFALAYSYDDDKNSGISMRLRGETIFQNSDDGRRDVDTYLATGFLNYRTNDNWRLLTSIDAAYNNKGDNAYSTVGDYINGSIGYAYRPIDNDRFNALFRYNFVYNLPDSNGRTRSTERNDPGQRSHIFSADVEFEAAKMLTLGAKYGFRIGQSNQQVSDPQKGLYLAGWQNSNAQLAVLRADFHVVEKWDLLTEGRVLYQPSSDSVRYGALAGVYRQVGENLKVGGGYNFGSFSDDLADQTYNDRGWFINIVGKI